MKELFFSSQNVNNILSQLHSNNANSPEELVSLVKKVMEFVANKVTDKVPQGMSAQQYNQLMNQKAIQLINPLLKQQSAPPITPVQRASQMQSGRAPLPLGRPQPSNELHEAFEKMPPLPENVLKRDFNLNNAIKQRNEEPINYIKQQANYDNQENYETYNNEPNLDDILNEVEEEFANNNANDEYYDNQEQVQEYYKEQIQKHAQEIQHTKAKDKDKDKDKDIIRRIKTIKEPGSLPLPFQNDVFQNELLMRPSDQEILVNNLEIVDNYSEKTDIKMVHETNAMRDPTYNPAVQKSPYPATTYPIIPPNRTKYIIRKHFISVDSSDRDLELYPSPTEFQVKFQPASDSVEVREIVDKNGNYLFQEKIRFVGDDYGASVDKRFDNIHSIAVSCAIFPLASRWVCGNCPSQYYGPVVPSGGVPNGPIFTNDVGINVTILDEPYVILNVKELESWVPYCGTNRANKKAFAKLIYSENYGILNKYVQFTTCNSNEKIVFEPQALSTLDKMTLSIRNCNDLPLNFENDKTFIANFGQGDVMRNCPSIFSTAITVIPPPECVPCPEMGHCLQPGDKIFIYRLKPLCEDIIPFNPDIELYAINVDEDCNNHLGELIFKIEGRDMKSQHLCFDGIINVGDYLALKYCYNGKIATEILRIYTVEGNILRVDLRELLCADIIEDIDVTSLGLVRNNPKGTISNKKDRINYIGGVNVCSIVDKYTFEVDFPFRCINLELQYGKVESQYFFIKQKLQISYTFEIETIEKDFEQIQSEAVF